MANGPQFLSGLTGAALVESLYLTACSASRVRDQARATWQCLLLVWNELQQPHWPHSTSNWPVWARS